MRWLVGSVLALALCSVAAPATSESCVPPHGGVFNPCAALDHSRVHDVHDRPALADAAEAIARAEQ